MYSFTSYLIYFRTISSVICKTQYITCKLHATTHSEEDYCYHYSHIYKLLTGSKYEIMNTILQFFLPELHSNYIKTYL